MSDQGWREFLSADGVDDWVMLHGGRHAMHGVDDSSAPGAWILADRSGNKVCIAAWPDGAAQPDSDGSFR